MVSIKISRLSLTLNLSLLRLLVSALKVVFEFKAVSKKSFFVVAVFEYANNKLFKLVVIVFELFELFELFGGKVMDTPGFSSLEFRDYSKEQIRDAFIEFKMYPCLYKDCMHTNEEECVVKKEVISNNILESRYKNYLNFII